MRATSYAAGTDAEPLLRETIGANLARTIRTFPDRDALIVPFQDVRYTYRQFGAEVDRVARALLARGLATGDRVGIWSPELCRVGRVAVRDRRGRCDPRQHQPGLSGVRARLRRWSSPGAACSFAATEFKTSDYRAMVDEVAPDLAALEQVVYLGTPDWDAFVGRAGDDRYRHRRPAGGRAQLRRSDQHPVHERHDGLPEGRDAQPPQHLEQRLLHRRGVRVHRGRPRVHSRAALPLLRHGARQPRLHDARRRDGVTRARLRAESDARDGRGRTLHEPVRRADDVHRRARSRRLRGVRTVVAADGDHGRRAVPGRGDEALRLRHAHGSRHDRLRHDRDVARVDADRGRRPDRPTRGNRRDASTPTSRSRSSTPTATRSNAAKRGSSAPAATP